MSEPTPTTVTGAADAPSALTRLAALVAELRQNADAWPGLPLLELAVQTLVRQRESCPAPLPRPGRWADQAAATQDALDALWLARKGLRREHAAAVATLAALNLHNVSPSVVEAVHGAWLRHCARLGTPFLLKYEASFGQAAVLAPGRNSDTLVVVSALGLPGWPPGTTVARREVPGARPLR